MVINFIKIKESDSKKIYNWRTKPRIEKFMKTRFSHSDNEQKKWITLSNKKKTFGIGLYVLKIKKLAISAFLNHNPKVKSCLGAFIWVKKSILLFLE